MNKSTLDTLVIYHRTDFDGLFCREIAKKSFGEGAAYLGWDYGDLPPVVGPEFHTLYLLDLSIPSLMADPRLVWIDHHKTAIDTYPATIPGDRIDGVAACRLAWQWFFSAAPASKQAYVDRLVAEPLAVRLAGEYDIWDKRDPRAELFQHGLRSCDLTDLWPRLLDDSEGGAGDQLVAELLAHGEGMAYAKREANASFIREFGFDVEWEGLRFLAANSARCNSHLFTAGLRPDHDACLAFGFTGREWKISLYGAPGKPDLDLSAIAKRHGGGGHRQACGFKVSTLPFAPFTRPSSPMSAEDFPTAELANAFLRWPLPESVCADLCTVKQGGDRSGTNLLSYVEAAEMMTEVVRPVVEKLTAELRAEVAQLKAAHWLHSLTPDELREARYFADLEGYRERAENADAEVTKLRVLFFSEKQAKIERGNMLENQREKVRVLREACEKLRGYDRRDIGLGDFYAYVNETTTEALAATEDEA
jgi:hypothetical protein